MSPKKQKAVIALGGNAITKKGVPDTIANQFAHTRQSLSGIIPLIKSGYNIVITHGNGPQVGNALLRVEMAYGTAPDLPLGICVADTEGGMGYMIEQSLQNRLRAEKIKRDVVTIVTQVIVDRSDPSMKNPEKYIGQFYDYNTARKYAKERKWQIKKDSDRGWRRVVPSPIPLEIVEARQIKTLVDEGTIVIAAGGGGIPIYVEDNGDYEGVDAVIDKDRASAVLANAIKAELLLILTSVDQVAINFGKLDQKFLGEVSYEDMKKYLKQGHFPPGSMGPKVGAALMFLERGGKKVIITSIDKAHEAVIGSAGTTITK